MFGKPKHIVCPACGEKIYEEPFSRVYSPDANPCGEISLNKQERTSLVFEEGEKE